MNFIMQIPILRPWVFSLLISAMVAWVVVGCTDSSPRAAIPASEQQTATLTITGELEASRAVKVAPPSITRMWNYNIKTMVAENTHVAEGDLVVAFDDKPVRDTLRDKQAELQQARSELENVHLQESRTERDDTLAVEEKRAEYEKTRRKAEILDQSLSRNERRKAQIDFKVAENDLALARALARLHRKTGALNISLAERKVERLEQETQALQAEVDKLKVHASISGLVQYIPNWEGEKPSEGDSIRFGQPVLEISDLGQMQLRAQIDEADKTRFARGAAVDVVLDGIAGNSLAGTVAELGIVVRDRARGDRRRVIDMLVTVETNGDALRPGMTAVVNLPENLVAKRDNTTHNGEYAEANQ